MTFWMRISPRSRGRRRPKTCPLPEKNLAGVDADEDVERRVFGGLVTPVNSRKQG